MPTNFVIPEGYQTLASGKVLAVLDILDWADVREFVLFSCLVSKVPASC